MLAIAESSSLEQALRQAYPLQHHDLICQSRHRDKEKLLTRIRSSDNDAMFPFPSPRIYIVGRMKNLSFKDFLIWSSVTACWFWAKHITYSIWILWHHWNLPTCSNRHYNMRASYRSISSFTLADLQCPTLFWQTPFALFEPGAGPNVLNTISRLL